MLFTNFLYFFQAVFSKFKRKIKRTKWIIEMIWDLIKRRPLWEKGGVEALPASAKSVSATHSNTNKAHQRSDRKSRLDSIVRCGDFPNSPLYFHSVKYTKYTKFIELAVSMYHPIWIAFCPKCYDLKKKLATATFHSNWTVISVWQFWMLSKLDV